MAPIEATNGLRRHAEHFDESTPHALRVGEAERLSDHLDGLCSLLQSHAGGLDTKPLDGLGRRLAGLAPECPPELTDTQMRRVRQAFDRQILVQVIPREGQRQAYAIRSRLHLGNRRELGLAAGTAVIHNQFARDLACQVRAMIRLDERQGQIDAGRHPGRRPDAAIANKDPVCVNLDRRIILLKPVRRAPMRRRASSIEQTRFGEQEGARADAGNPRGPAGETRNGLHFARLQHRGYQAAADDKSVKTRIPTRLCRYWHAATAGDGAASARVDFKPVERPPGQPPRRLKGGEWPGEVQDLVVRDDVETDAVHDGAF